MNKLNLKCNEKIKNLSSPLPCSLSVPCLAYKQLLRVVKEWIFVTKIFMENFLWQICHRLITKKAVVKICNGKDTIKSWQVENFQTITLLPTKCGKKILLPKFLWQSCNNCLSITENWLQNTITNFCRRNLTLKFNDKFFLV